LLYYSFLERWVKLGRLAGVGRSVRERWIGRGAGGEGIIVAWIRSGVVEGKELDAVEFERFARSR